MYMYAIRQIQPVQNGMVVVQLPKDWTSQSVEVIILPQEQNDAEDAIHDFLRKDTSHLTSAQQQAYARSCALIQRGRRPEEPRILGLFAGLGKVADDFNDPLPDEAQNFDLKMMRKRNEIANFYRHSSSGR